MYERCGTTTRWAHTPQSLTKTRRVIFVPLSHYRRAPLPIATPHQGRPASPFARPSSPFVRPSSPLARPSRPLSVRPSVRPAPLPGRLPCPPGAAHARAGARSSPRSGAARPREERASRDTREPPAPRDALRAAVGGLGRAMAGAGCCLCAGAGGAVRVTAGLAQARAPGQLPVGGGCAPRWDTHTKPRCSCPA